MYSPCILLGVYKQKWPPYHQGGSLFKIANDLIIKKYCKWFVKVVTFSATKHSIM